MTVLESIQLRSVGAPLHALGEQIHQEISEGDHPRGQSVDVYTRAGIETELAVHIRRRSRDGSTGRSEPGLRLANALKRHGLVEHTVWQRVERSSAGEAGDTR